MTKSKIEWTDRVWNPVRGCSMVSRGCENCYAMRQAHRFSGPGLPFEGLTKSTKNGPKWTGTVELMDEVLGAPLRWKKPSKVFVNSMSDLFHEDVPFEFIDLVFAAMAIAQQHTFQILTKRPERALDWFNHKDRSWHPTMEGDQRIRFQTYHHFGHEVSCKDWKWPLPNVWIGASAEDQGTANKRLPYLLQVPASLRFLSCEPLLGPLTLHGVRNELVYNWLRAIDWVIVGGESGPNARPMHPDWVRAIRDQCQNTGTPFFFKQWGKFRPFQRTAQDPFVRDCASRKQYDAHHLNFVDPETHEPGKSPWGFCWSDLLLQIEGVHLDCFDCYFLDMGKSRSGNFLDGHQHLEFPFNHKVK